MAEVIKSTPQEFRAPPEVTTSLSTTKLELGLPVSIGFHNELTASEPRILSAQLKAKILRESFRHSQSNPTLQAVFLRTAASENPNNPISDEEREEILAIATPQIMRYALGPNHDNPNLPYRDDPQVQLEKVALSMQTFFGEDQQIDQLVTTAASGILLQDFNFLSRENGRVRKSPGNYPPNDPWFSFLCHYSLNQNPTGLVEFDRVYSGVRDYFRSARFLGPTVDEELGFIIDKHNQHHPDQSISWKEAFPNLGK